MADKDFVADSFSDADFIQSRIALREGLSNEHLCLLDFVCHRRLDDYNCPTTLTLELSIADTRKLVRNGLEALAYVGDQPAQVMLKLLS